MTTERTIRHPHPRDESGKRMCRWCSGPVPKGRISWCSTECVHSAQIRSNPAYAREQVFKRDHGLCSQCGADSEKVERIIRVTADWGRGFIQTRETIDVILRAWGRYRKGFHGNYAHYSLWEMDHVVPVVEGGGGCGLENLRTLCRPCHLLATRELRARMRKAK